MWLIYTHFLVFFSQIGKPASFTCVFNGAKGELHAKVVAPSGAEDEALCQSLDDSNCESLIILHCSTNIHDSHLINKIKIIKSLLIYLMFCSSPCYPIYPEGEWCSFRSRHIGS